MKIAVEGCAHGELDNIYDSIQALEQEQNIKVDLLICCGDFQAVRNECDLRCMSIPEKYYNICTFYKYYSKEKTAPILTIFIGGNHEASNYLQELPFGGWVAPNIFYLGYGGVINIGGLRIGGISGIYKGHDYMKGHYEMSPYSDSAKYSVYHIRNVEIFRFKQLTPSMDIFLSHDWPSDITKYGNVDQLLKFKPFFRKDIDAGRLGSPPCNEVLFALKPKFWFAAHLHCKFAALVEHEDGNTTKFLALDKCLPQRRFLQVLDVPHDKAEGQQIKYDLEWLAVLRNTNHLFSVKNTTQYMPSSKSGEERWNFRPTEEEKQKVLQLFQNDLTIPQNFSVTADSYVPGSPISGYGINQPIPQINPQTTDFCTKLEITNPNEIACKSFGDTSTDFNSSNHSLDTNFISIHNNSDFNKSASPTSISPIKRLSLPKPLNLSEGFEEGFQKDVRVKEADDEGVIDITSEDVGDKPIVKKLKRRNASVYSAEENL